MNEKEVLQFLTRYKSAFLSEISDSVMKSPDQVEKMLLNLSNTGLVKTVSAGEGLYVLPEISILLQKTSTGKDLAKNLSKNLAEVKNNTKKMNLLLGEKVTSHFEKTRGELVSEVISTVRTVIEKPISSMFKRLIYELSKSVTLHEKRILSELKVLEAPINVLSSQVEKSSKEINKKLEAKINECSEKITSKLPEFKEELKILLNKKITDAFKKEETYRLISFERIEASETKIRNIILEVGQILERILVVFEKTLEELKYSIIKSIKESLSFMRKQVGNSGSIIVEDEMKKVMNSLSKRIEEMINKYISQIDVDLRFITEDFRKQTSEMEKRVAEDYKDLKEHLKNKFEEYPKFLSSLAEFMISKAVDQIEDWINEFKETLASWMDDVINFTSREFLRLKNITISTNARIIEEFSKYIQEIKDIVNFFVKERELKFVNELITSTIAEVRNNTVTIVKPLLEPIKENVSKTLSILDNVTLKIDDSLKDVEQIKNVLVNISGELRHIVSSKDTWIAGEEEAIELIGKILSLNIPWKINLILPSCKLLTKVLKNVAVLPRINIYCHSSGNVSIKVPENVKVIRTGFKGVIALDNEMISLLLLPVGDKAVGIATTNNVFRIMLNVLIKNIIATIEQI